MKILKKTIVIILANIIFISNIYALEINSKTAVLYNLNDDSIVLDIDKDKRVSIASLTKIMTTLVAIEHIEDMDMKVTITYDMIKGLIAANAYVIGLRVGQVVTIKDLLYATFIESGADAARGLAISIAGSEDKYVELMNSKARELELDLHFANVVGLDDPENYGTTDSVAKLLKEALKNEIFVDMFLTKEFILSDNSRLVRNTMFNSAIYYKIDIPYIIGGKTGYTDNAGKCLASVAIDEDNNIRYLLVTTGADTTTKNAYHILDAKNIYEYYFNNYKYYNVLNIDDILADIKVKYSKNLISIKSTDNIIIYHDNTFDISKIKIEYEGIDEISPFIDKDIVLGNAYIYYDDELLSTKVIISDMLDNSILKDVQKNIGYICVIIIVILMSILFIIHEIIKKKFITKKAYEK